MIERPIRSFTAILILWAWGCSDEKSEGAGDPDNKGYQDPGVGLSGDPPEITGSTYYIDPNNGDDANPGTSEAEAWKTLENAASAGFGSPGGDMGTLQNALFEYNVSENSKWLFLLQTMNTVLDNVTYQNNTILYTAVDEDSAASGGTIVGIFYGGDESVDSGDLMFQNNIVVMTVNAFQLFMASGFDH